jgi:hypothetical protein
MGRLARRLVLLLVLAMPSWVSASGAQGANSTQALAPGSPRVRASDPIIAEAIEQAAAQSPTFNQLVTAITTTNGIVYVHFGECGRNVRACLLLGITQAGSNRILHIKVDRRRRGQDLMVVIGHELSHAVELLNEPTVVDATTAQNFYRRNAAIEKYSFETEAAIEIELKIDKELRRWANQR